MPWLPTAVRTGSRKGVRNGDVELAMQRGSEVGMLFSYSVANMLPGQRTVTDRQGTQLGLGLSGPAALGDSAHQHLHLPHSFPLALQRRVSANASACPSPSMLPLRLHKTGYLVHAVAPQYRAAVLQRQRHSIAGLSAVIERIEACFGACRPPAVRRTSSMRPAY